MVERQRWSGLDGKANPASRRTCRSVYGNRRNEHDLLRRAVPLATEKLNGRRIISRPVRRLERSQHYLHANANVRAHVGRYGCRKPCAAKVWPRRRSANRQTYGPPGPAVGTLRRTSEACSSRDQHGKKEASHAVNLIPSRATDGVLLMHAAVLISEPNLPCWREHAAQPSAPCTYVSPVKSFFA